MERNNYITPKGYKKLVDEQEYLLKVERPEATKVVTWAASLGDRSENADYIYGKKKLREIDRRLRFLAKRINAANVVDPSQIKSSKVQFSATVIVLDEDGRRKKYAIVGEDETNTKEGLISWKSPIAKGLLGKSIGESVEVETPSGEIELEIIEIEYKEIY